DYNAVVSLQASALDSERNWLSLKGNRLLASAQLITALGGGGQAGEGAEAAAARP
ncbi:MAG: RND transporter, partial [Aquabacterium sp.]